MRWGVGGLGLSLALLALGCASFELNPKLGQVDLASGYRLEKVDDYPHPRSQSSARTFFVVTLSGGGTRAAALAYGALQHLRRTPIGDGTRTLLDEVDVLSSVSGGSFAAAYYGLFGEEFFFDRFRVEVLDRKIQRSLLLRVLAPWNWPRLLSPRFGRSDLLNDYYDRRLFDRRTYADMPRAKPLILINATDMSQGAQLTFVQEHFDRICSDLDGVQVSRAVLASSAFPGAFTPLTFRNYNRDAPSCGYTAPTWVDVSFGADAACRQDPTCRGNLEANPRQFDLARNWKSYEDGRRRPFLHLVDGGVADNIGLRGPIGWIVFGEGREWSVLSQVAQGQVDRIVVLIVDAKPRQEPRLDLEASPPNLLSVLSAAASRPMANYSGETVELLRHQFAAWRKDGIAFEGQRRLCEQAAERHCGAGTSREECRRRERDRCFEDHRLTDRFRPPDPRLHRIHLRFDAVRDAAQRRRLQQIPTKLQLPAADVDLLIDTAATLLSESEAFQELVRDLDGAS